MQHFRCEDGFDAFDGGLIDENRGGMSTHIERLSAIFRKAILALKSTRMQDGLAVLCESESYKCNAG